MFNLGLSYEIRMPVTPRLDSIRKILYVANYPWRDFYLGLNLLVLLLVDCPGDVEGCQQTRNGQKQAVISQIPSRANSTTIPKRFSRRVWLITRFQVPIWIKSRRI